MQIAVAILAKDHEKASKVAATAIGSAAEQIMQIANGFQPMDLPFVVAAMKLMAATFENGLDESGKNIVKSLTDNTTCVAVDSETLKKMYENGRD